MATTNLRVKITEGFETLNKMAQSSMFFEGWANRRLPRLYANAQRTRWMTEGASEGPKWKKLSSGYAASKKWRFASYPGAGNVVLIATSRLLAGLLPPEERKNERSFGEEFRKIIQNKKVTFKTTVPYADDVNQERPFSVWTQRTMNSFVRDYKTYLIASIRGQSPSGK